MEVTGTGSWRTFRGHAALVEDTRPPKGTWRRSEGSKPRNLAKPERAGGALRMPVKACGCWLAGVRWSC